MSPRRWWARPGLWLALQAVAVFGVTVARTDLETVTYRDSRGYLRVLERETLAQKLSHRRTPGYPLLIKAVQTLPGGLARLPHVQLALYLACVVAFGLAAGLYLGSGSEGGSGWTGLLVATPLFYVRLLPLFTAAMLPDVPAAALALVALAGLLALAAWPASRRTRILAWAALGIGAFAAYQLRPAYLFLLPLLPILGVVLHWLGRRGQAPQGESAEAAPSAGRPRAWRFAASLVAIVLSPFLAWSAFRWAVTGHFGLVSFGGFNLIGITSSMLTPELVPRLPAAHRPLAEAIVERRREVGYQIAPAYDFAEWKRLYNANIFYIAYKAVWKLPDRPRGGAGGTWVYANRQFTGLSWALIRLEPGLYTRWLRDASGLFVERMVSSRLLRGAALAAAASALAAGLVHAVARARGRAGWSRLAGWPGPRSAGLALVAVAYAAASALLVVLVESPIDRYVVASELLLPSGLVALAAGFWRPSPTS
jgi:hypothetical protein